MHALVAGLYLMFQVGTSIANGGSALLHLTYWTIVATVVYHTLAALSDWLGTRTVPAVFHAFATQQAVLVAWSMTALTASDDAVMRDAEESLGPFMAGAGNLAFHYLPPLVNWWFIITWPEHFMGWYARCHPVTLAYACLGLPVFFTICYSTLYDPHVQYEGDFNSIVVFAAGFGGAIVGGCLLYWVTRIIA